MPHGCWPAHPHGPVDSTASSALLPLLERRCKEVPLRREFWKKVMRREVKLISKTETPASQLDSSQADQAFSQRMLA